MTKEKQIEEMAKVLRDRTINKTWRAEKVAKELYEIAIPKDRVVVSKEEYEKLTIPRVYITQKKLTNKELTEMFDKSMFSVIQDNSTIEIIPTRAEIEKETAEKIFAMLQGIGTLHTEFDWNDYLQIDVYDFYKLAKQFGVEIKE